MPGGEIALSEGSFSISTTIATTKNNLTVSGKGRSTVLNLAANTILFDIGSIDVDTVSPMFRDFELGGVSGIYPNGIGIRMRRITLGIIERVNIATFGGYGLVLDGIKHFKIKGCGFDSNLTSGDIYLANAPLDTRAVWIEDCILEHSPYQITLSLDGILKDFSSIHLLNNDFRFLSGGANIRFIGSGSHAANRIPTIFIKGNVSATFWPIQPLTTGQTTLVIQETSGWDDCDFIIKGNCIGHSDAPALAGGKGIYLTAPSVESDVEVISPVFDLSGASTDSPPIYLAKTPSVIINARVLYTEASSADAGVKIRIGKLGDTDYFYNVDSDASKSLGDSVFKSPALFTKKIVPVGTAVTVGTAGLKTGAGEVQVILTIATNIEVIE